MALSAADFQKAFTVNVPVGDIFSKGIQDIREDEAERERKRLQNVEYFYKQYDPLLIGTGTPDDPYINKLLQDVEQRAMSLPLKKMSQSQFVSAVRSDLATIKARREQAKLFAQNIENEATALHELDPSIKKEALVREAKRKAFFNDDNTPVQEFDFNRNYAKTTFDSNPLQYVDIDFAGGAFNKETKNKLIKATNVPSEYDPNVRFDVSRTIYQKPTMQKGGAATLETVYQPVVVSKDLTLKALPDEQFNAMVSSPGGKWLIQSELKKYKADPRLAGVSDEVLLHAAAYDVAENKVDRSDTEINAKFEPKYLGGGDSGRSGIGTQKAVGQDINPNNAVIGSAQGNQLYLRPLRKASGTFGDQGWYNATTHFDKGKFVIGNKTEDKINFSTGAKEQVETPIYGKVFTNPNTGEVWITDSNGKNIEKFNVKTTDGANYYYNKYGLNNNTTGLEGYNQMEIHQSPTVQQMILNDAISKKQLSDKIEQQKNQLKQYFNADSYFGDIHFNMFQDKRQGVF